MTPEQLSVIGTIISALVATIIGLALALSRTRERLARLEALVERLLKQ